MTSFLTGAGLLLAMVSSGAIAASAWAGVPLAGATVRHRSHQVSAVSTAGAPRSVAVADRLLPGETLTTAARSRAELLFDDGTLTRLGEHTHLGVWPEGRQLRLGRGTAVVFVPPHQGRTTLDTPNARVGLNSSAVVVRYVPSRDLTLVMALATPEPLSISTTAPAREISLRAGEMALISGVSWQVVEFDLLEFYRTSELVAGLHLADPNYRPDGPEPLAALRPYLTAALGQQAPFSGQEVVLDPALIGPTTAIAPPPSALAGTAVPGGRP